MSSNTEGLIMLRIFVNDAGEYGNPVAIFLDLGKKLSVSQRQIRATQSGLSEVVFINNLESPDISIYTPQQEIQFAGHAVLGAVKYLSDLLKKPVTSITCLGNIISCEYDNSMIWVTANISTLPPWNFQELHSPQEVERLTAADCIAFQHMFVWAWIDKTTGVIRARTFASDWDIPEDEANGSGSMRLAYDLNREIKVIHGKGSIIFARPEGNSSVAVGGVVLEAKF